ncbi:thioredoxin family protein [bacterium]|nr:thioredoxin family protein [bacterium]
MLWPRAENTAPEASAESLPRLLDLGSTTCITCKKMTPILEELSQTFADQLLVEFIDVRANPEAGEGYNLRLIPTQIFFDRQGRELYRHEGFMGRDDILSTWRDLGLDLIGDGKQNG